MNFKYIKKYKGNETIFINGFFIVCTQIPKQRFVHIINYDKENAHDALLLFVYLYLMYNMVGYRRDKAKENKVKYLHKSTLKSN